MKTIYSYGKEFYSCFSCNKELTIENPGQRVMYVQKPLQFVEHVCNDCFNETDYQDCIKDISNKYGMEIRSFPQYQD